MLPIYNPEFFHNNLDDHLLEFTISNPLFLDILLMEIRGKQYRFQHLKRKRIKKRKRN